MKQKHGRKAICLALSTMMLAGAVAGCKGGGTSEDVKFWVYGSREEIDQYTRLVDAFNDSYGKNNGFEVDIVTKDTGGYYSAIQTTANSEKTGPDVFFVADADYKSYLRSKYFCNLQEYMDQVDDIDIGIESGDMRKTTYSRLRYNVETNTSNDDDPLYGLPLDSQPSALYYNKTMFEKAGIAVISVDEEDLDKWNNNEIPDKTGKYKRDFDKLDGVTVPAKGYYRSKNPYYYSGLMTKAWTKPTADTVLVFNNRIAMNWDEVEDLASLFSAETNPLGGDKKATKSEYGTQYGYFTENWFNYGWSVGGDCLQDLTGNGDWNFSLLDPNPNYVVNTGTYTGLNTGKEYKAGDTIEFLDKMDVAKGEAVVADDYGDYHHTSKDGALVGIRQDIKDKETAGVLSELPSTRDAFCRYLKLGAETDSLVDGEGGLNISPNPDIFKGTTSAISSFWSQNIALHANLSVYMVSLSERAQKSGFEWDVAPLVVYKEYENPADGNNDKVVAQGKKAGHSNTRTMVLRTKSPKKLQATKFIMWAASAQGQKIRAELGFFPNQQSLVDDIKFDSTKSAANVSVFTEALEYQRCGDWMYMPDYAWVHAWCIDLNSKVRNGSMSFDEWYSDAIKATNNKLLEYKQWSWN